METLTVTAARQNLGTWLARAARGEEIGIISGSQIIALRPVRVEAADYMEQTYGLTKEEADRAAAKIREEARAAIVAGDYVELADSPASRRRRRAARAARG